MYNVICCCSEMCRSISLSSNGACFTRINGICDVEVVIEVHMCRGRSFSVMLTTEAHSTSSSPTYVVRYNLSSSLGLALAT